MSTNSHAPPPPARALPALNKDIEAYWKGGERNELMIYRCGDCRYYVHPPVRFCPKCESRRVGPEAVCGKGQVVTYSVNHKQWVPGLPPKYVVALVSIAEQDDVRLPCNIVNCDPENVHIGQKVRVLFEQHEDLWVPFFEPDDAR